MLSPFTQLEEILKHANPDRPDDEAAETATRAGLEDFFSGPMATSVDWTMGAERQTTAHLFVRYLHPDSSIWDAGYLKRLHDTLPIFLQTQLLLNHSDDYAESPLREAYYKREDHKHPLIIMALRYLLRTVDFNPDAADELIEGEKKDYFVQALRTGPRPGPTLKPLLTFYENIDALEKAGRGPRISAKPPAGGEAHSLGLN